MKLSLDTVLPLSLVGSLCGGAFWLAGLNAVVSENARAATKLESRQERLEETMTEQNREILQRLSRIEGKLNKKF